MPRIREPADDGRSPLHGFTIALADRRAPTTLPRTGTGDEDPGTADRRSPAWVCQEAEGSFAPQCATARQNGRTMALSPRMSKPSDRISGEAGRRHPGSNHRASRFWTDGRGARGRPQTCGSVPGRRIMPRPYEPLPSRSVRLGVRITRGAPRRRRPGGSRRHVPPGRPTRTFSRSRCTISENPVAFPTPSPRSHCPNCPWSKTLCLT